MWRILHPKPRQKFPHSDKFLHYIHKKGIYQFFRKQKHCCRDCKHNAILMPHRQKPRSVIASQKRKVERNHHWDYHDHFRFHYSLRVLPLRLRMRHWRLHLLHLFHCYSKDKWTYLIILSFFLTINWVDAWGVLLPFTALSLSTLTRCAMKYKALKAPVKHPTSL